MKFQYLGDGYKYYHSDMYPDEVKQIKSVTYIRNPKMDLEFTKGNIVVYGITNIIRQIDEMLVELKFKNESDFFYFISDRFDLENSSFIQNLDELRRLLDENRFSYLSDICNIKAVDDGTFVKPSDAVLEIENKKEYPQLRWLPNYLETFINAELWKYCYIATQSASYVGAMLMVNPNFTFKDMENKIHDFSARGMSGFYDSHYHNIAHLLFFNGTDVFSLNDSEFLNNDDKIELGIGKVVPATEHSIMCSYGQDREEESIISLMKKFLKQPLSIVIDSYDMWGLIHRLASNVEFNELLSIRGKDNPLILRGDSGDPVKIMAGDVDSDNKYAKMGLVKTLKYLFLDTFERGGIKAIYGDAITPTRCYEIFKGLDEDLRDNLVLGVGSYTYNYATRDSIGMVTKAYCYKDSDGVEHRIVKNPATDTKKASLSINLDKLRAFTPSNFMSARENAREWFKNVYCERES